MARIHPPCLSQGPPPPTCEVSAHLIKWFGSLQVTNKQRPHSSGRVSDMKLIKNRLRNRLTELSLSNSKKIVIESTEKLTDSDLEEIVDVWNRNGRQIVV